MGPLVKPLPSPDARTAPFWAAAARHVLALQRCDACGRFAHPPVIVCPSCHSGLASFSFVPVSGFGVLRTWTIMRDAFLPAFRADVPWVIGEAELDGAPGVRLLARMADPPDAPLRYGAPVETQFEDLAPGVAIPVLALREG
ncbi:MAG TPA: OB-fold domain-containing protein [Acidimicrobiales bacterium]|nr:OB-fold domain-containing protein [Acidimicrobiales bacterium]